MKPLFIVLLVLNSIVFAQGQAPKLIVGIVVDQMRYDYINRYWDDFSEGGFKRLVAEGYNCTNTHYNYIPTYTGPGHASIYTGATPSTHGIISNSWFNKDTEEYGYCVSDPTMNTIGADNESGKMSPSKMLTTTFGDEMRLFSMNRSKVIAIGLKDRSAVLPAGHMGNFAFWLDSETGDFVSSSYYGLRLPKWAQKFNKRNLCETYLSEPWNLLLNSKDYDESLVDNSVYEGPFKGQKYPKFPHDLPSLIEENGKGLIKSTPFGNTLTKDMAIAAIEGERLGQDEHTDLLAISFSPPDYVGHQFGADSRETQDTYLRLDRDIETFLSYLDENLGKENVLVFLTSDHGAVRTPAYLKDRNIPAGYFDAEEPVRELKQFLQNIYGFGEWVKTYGNAQVFLNRELIFEKYLSLEEVQQQTANFMLRYDGVQKAICAHSLENNEFDTGSLASLQKGYHQKRSGDVLLVLDPAWIEYHHTGTTHGSGYTYDQHVPLIWYGWNVKSGKTTEKTAVTDIASTISSLLGISFPNGSLANVIPIPLGE
ncbi:MAG: alkaline phosphatase family protein [Flavobacteriales bacterium]|nr:alkaline phosphatase family protein [Flavobacteriales bacterium]